MGDVARMDGDDVARSDNVAMIYTIESEGLI